MEAIIIAGIHTGIGKTIASAVLCEALKADYWKPVQAGSLNEKDSDVVRTLISNKKTIIHKEAFLLRQAMSPHAAAKIDGVEIEIKKIKIPETNNKLIIETAGGIMSPLNETQTNLDLIIHLNFPVIIVSENYLGSINHTLLTVQALKTKEIKILGILFNGEENIETEKYILSYTRLPLIGKLNYYKKPNKDVIKIEAGKLERRFL